MAENEFDSQSSVRIRLMKKSSEICLFHGENFTMVYNEELCTGYADETRRKTVVQLVGILLWTAGAVITMSWGYGIRSYVRSGQGVSQLTVNQTMMFAISLIIVPIFGFSPFHLLWMFPVSLILGMLSLFFPFSLLSGPGKTFGTICCIGLTQRQATGSINLFDEDGNYKPLDQMTPEERKAFDAEMRRLTIKLKEADFD
jgi:hypothetical protein